MTHIDETFERARAPISGPYALYAGKLAANKGVQFLLDAYQQAGVGLPLVVAGDGPMRGALLTEAAARRIDLRILGWLGRAEALTWMRHATLLAFPSYGPESLSRVLIEAAALGVPIAAMDTGGTRDILRPGTTALVAADTREFTRDLARLASDEALRASLGAAAREDVRVRFAAPVIVAQIEGVYRSLLMPLAA
jgi:glycosyltransferase involved in cell wall biosynthesis